MFFVFYNNFVKNKDFKIEIVDLKGYLFPLQNKNFQITCFLFYNNFVKKVLKL